MAAPPGRTRWITAVWRWKKFQRTVVERPTDQRGYARPGTKNQPTNQCEVGAWEAQDLETPPRSRCAIYSHGQCIAGFDRCSGRDVRFARAWRAVDRAACEVESAVLKSRPTVEGCSVARRQPHPTLQRTSEALPVSEVFILPLEDDGAGGSASETCEDILEDARHTIWRASM